MSDVTGPVVFVKLIGNVARTFTRRVQLVLGASVAPDRLTLLDPETAVTLPPPHVPVSPFGVATTRPPGNASVKATPVSATVLAFAMVKVRLVLPFS